MEEKKSQILSTPRTTITPPVKFHCTHTSQALTKDWTSGNESKQSFEEPTTRLAFNR